MISITYTNCVTGHDSIKHADNKERKHNIFHQGPFKFSMQTRLKGKRVRFRIDIHSEMNIRNSLLYNWVYFLIDLLLFLIDLLCLFIFRTAQ